MVGYAAAGLHPGVHRGLPSDSLVMVFSIDEPLHTAATWQDWKGRRLASQWTVLGGLHTAAAWVDQPGRWCGIQVALHPLTTQLALEHGGGVRPEVAEVWRCLDRSRGQVRIADLAQHVGYSRRRITDVFRAETGLSPKTAARLMRFHAARRTLALRSTLGGALDIAGIAVSSGYYDHAHLVREFTEFAGLGPTSWLREEFPNVQAGAAAQAAR